MFRFAEDQLVFEIGGVKIGGQPGENPTVMIGSIFYKGDKLIQDEKAGIFDKDKARDLISNVEEISERLGLPSMLDVVCTNSEATANYLEFVVDATRMPILIDSVSEDVALTGLEIAADLGIIERTVLNSINPETKETVYDRVRDVGLECSVLLTYSSTAIVSSRERVNIVDKLMPKMRMAGIKKILVDTVVMDVPTLGLACKAIYEVKQRFGLPSGCGAHNAVASWKALKDKKDKMLSTVCSSIVNGLPISIGADFVLYGPIKDADYMFPSIGLINAAYGQVLMEEGKRPSAIHPRFRIGRI